MPDLGKYGETVLSAYAASVLLLVILVGVSLWRGRRVRAEMAKLENRMSRNG